MYPRDASRHSIFHALTLMVMSFVLALSLSACASKNNEPVAKVDNQPVGTSNNYQNSTVTPGSQVDLVTNVGDRVYFAVDQSSLSAEAQSQLQRQAAWLDQFPQNRVTIEGHADERGTREYNLALGDRRATAARDYLVSLGISAERIHTISYGKERPVELCSEEMCWAKNRRAVMVVDAYTGS